MNDDFIFILYHPCYQNFYDRAAEDCQPTFKNFKKAIHSAKTCADLDYTANIVFCQQMKKIMHPKIIYFIRRFAFERKLMMWTTALFDSYLLQKMCRLLYCVGDTFFFGYRNLFDALEQMLNDRVRVFEGHRRVARENLKNLRQLVAKEIEKRFVNFATPLAKSVHISVGTILQIFERSSENKNLLQFLSSPEKLVIKIRNQLVRY